MSADFSFRGFLDDHEVAGRVRDGKVTGNPFVTIAVEALVANDIHVGLGPWSGAATLQDDILARATVAAVVDGASFDPAVIRHLVGNLPEGAQS
jgi:hypothetical protein